jgi:hypothetical protein
LGIGTVVIFGIGTALGLATYVAMADGLVSRYPLATAVGFSAAGRRARAWQNW